MDKTQKKKIVSINFSHALFFGLEFLTLEKVGMIGCPKMSGRNYYSTLRNISEEHRSRVTIWQCRTWLGSALVQFKGVRCSAVQRLISKF